MGFNSSRPRAAPSDSRLLKPIIPSAHVLTITYIPPTIQFVLGKGCFKCDKIPPMGKNAIKSPLEGKMLIKSLPQAILAKFESVKWIFSWQNLFC